MKKKKGIILLVIGLGIAVAVFFFRDSTNTEDIHNKQEASIEETTRETLSDDNDLFSDDADFGDVEAAPVALDTTKAEK
jgi:hypothetical protein